ncbi:MAG: F0F1 ATP synthase subunit B [Lachnospiraceae bacterium]
MGTLMGHYGYMLLSAGTETASKTEEGRIFGIDPQLLFDAAVLAINIFILFVLLSYLLFNPVRKLLTERQEKISAEREQTASDRETARTLKSEYEEKLKNIDKEVEVILSDARKKALKNGERIENEAKEEAARIIAHAKSEAELEKKKAADDVKKEIILVSTLMANKLVAASVDRKTQDFLVEETLREIGDDTWLS